MSAITNNTGVGLSLAVWLAHDDYDHNPASNAISVTTLIKPVKQIILATRLKPEHLITPDVAGMVANRIGTAIHNEIERVWRHHRDTSLALLGYPKKVIDLVRINPTEKYIQDNPNILPVYVEQRASKQVGNWLVQGKYDIVIEGTLEDFKSTKTYTFTKGTNDEKQILQGSLYRWLSPNIITNDHMKIQYIFTDWKAMEALRSQEYPQTQAVEVQHKLMSVHDTSRYVNDKIIAINKLYDAPENEMPPCSDEDLWRSDAVFKYYKSGKVTARSTKNFDTELEAIQRKIDDGNVGIVVEIKGEIKACKYCAVCLICQQKDAYLADGSLKL